MERLEREEVSNLAFTCESIELTLASGFRSMYWGMLFPVARSGSWLMRAAGHVEQIRRIPDQVQLAYSNPVSFLYGYGLATALTSH